MVRVPPFEPGKCGMAGAYVGTRGRVRMRRTIGLWQLHYHKISEVGTTGWAGVECVTRQSGITSKLAKGESFSCEIGEERRSNASFSPPFRPRSDGLAALPRLRSSEVTHSSRPLCVEVEGASMSARAS